MDDVKDYYKILGVERTASSEQIKKAYMKLIKMYHPDLHPGNNRVLYIFQEIAEAYNVIGNLDNRLKYSQLLNRRIFIPKDFNNNDGYKSKK